MEKDVQGNSSNMSIPPAQHPRSTWGIFHVLKYHRWNRRFIKKRIQHKRHDAEPDNSRDESVEASDKNAHDSSKHNNAQAPNSKVEGKKRVHNPGSKTSVKSRLKALITEEVLSKRKGRGKHHRNSTYPIQSKSDPDHDHVDAHIDDLLPDRMDGSPRTAEKNKGVCYESGSEDLALPKSSEEQTSTGDENDEECGPSNGKVDEHTKKLLDSAILSEEDLNAKTKALKEHGKDKDGPGYESKYLMDALDIIKMNQGFLLTVLQDPDSPLAQHFHKHLAISAKMGMPQPETFASNASTSRTRFADKEKESDVSFDGEKAGDNESAQDLCRKSMPLIAADHRADGIHNLNQAKAEMTDMSSSAESHNTNRSIGSEMARKRFEILRENLKRVIEERKKERHRIAMDAVLHKIPHQKGFSKDLTKDIVDHFKDPSRIRKNFSSSLARMGSMQLERRTSFNESIDRYTQLYESSFNREVKEENISKRIQERRDEAIDSGHRTVKKYMRRILSSPELYSSSYLNDAISSDMPINIEDSTLSLCSLNEIKFLDVSEALSYISGVDTLGKTESEDNSLGIREVFPVPSSDQLSSNSSINSKPIAQTEKTSDESENLVIIRDNISEVEQHIKPEIVPITKLEEPSCEGPTDSSAESSKLQDLELKQSFEDVELEYLRDLQREFKDTPKVAAGGRVEGLKKDLDINEFTYVKDVLELSGFSGNEVLGAWHADNQPLDPMMYEEIKGCIICDPDCSMEGEIGYCNHPLLFDLINEVLIDVYERSYSYYPRVLSPLCHIRPMPIGRHVLEQVWERISWYLSFKTGYDKPLDYVASRDLTRNDGWMNLQFEHECLAIEVEDLIFDDLLDEFSSST